MNKEKFIKALNDLIVEGEQRVLDQNTANIEKVMLVTIVEYQRELLKLVESGVFDNE